MTHDRRDRILSELAHRYALQPDFVGRLAPVVSAILACEGGAAVTTPLLELLAETCEREQHRARDSQRLIDAFRRASGDSFTAGT